MAKKKNAFTRFLQQRNWFVSAGLVMLIYITGQLSLGFYLVDTSNIRMVFHALPLIAILMVVLGILEKRQGQELDRERKNSRTPTTCPPTLA